MRKYGLSAAMFKAMSLRDVCEVIFFDSHLIARRKMCTARVLKLLYPSSSTQQKTYFPTIGYT